MGVPGPALARVAVRAWRPCMIRATRSSVTRIAVGYVVATRGGTQTMPARLRATASCAARNQAAAAAAVGVVGAPLRAHHNDGGEADRWPGRTAGGGSRGFGCGVLRHASRNRRGIISAAATDGDGDGDGGNGGGDDEDAAPSLSAAEQSELDVEAAAFAASWASELSAAAWEEMGEEKVRMRSAFQSRTRPGLSLACKPKPPAFRRSQGDFDFGFFSF